MDYKYTFLLTTLALYNKFLSDNVANDFLHWHELITNL